MVHQDSKPLSMANLEIMCNIICFPKKEQQVKPPLISSYLLLSLLIIVQPVDPLSERHMESIFAWSPDSNQKKTSLAYIYLVVYDAAWYTVSDILLTDPITYLQSALSIFSNGSLNLGLYIHEFAAETITQECFFLPSFSLMSACWLPAGRRSHPK